MNSTPVTGIQNYTTSRTTDSSSCRDAMCIFFAVAKLIIFILGVAGNSLVIWIAGFKVKVKSVVTTWYLSLAVSDFIFCSTLPFYVIYRVTKNWPFGLFMCKFNSFMMWLNLYSSTLLLTIISVDRCVVVMFPVWAQNQRTVRRASVIVMTAWIISAALSTPSLVLKIIRQNDYEQKTLCIYRFREKNYAVTIVCRFIFLFVIPFLIIFICYVLIMRKLSNQRVKPRKPIKIMTLLIVTFLICWLPFHTVFLISILRKNNVRLIIKKLTFILANVNSCLNPFLYAFMGKDIKEQWYALQSKIENAFKEEQDQDTTSGSHTITSGERIPSTSI